MKAPGCPGPISMKTGRRQEKPSVWMRIGAERNDGIGSGELMATGDGVCGCAAPGPAVLAVLTYLATPTYFRPMFESVVGWLLLSILATASSVAYGLAEVGVWSFRKGRGVLGVIALVGYSVSLAGAVAIVVFGPAALILMKPRS